MFSLKDLRKILFLDIETVPIQPQFTDLSPAMQQLWEHKAQWIEKESTLSAAEKFEQRAGIYAEFGKVIVISTAMLQGDDDDPVLKLYSFADTDENMLLTQFSAMVEKLQSRRFPDLILCAHNGKEFDFPYLGRRMLVNQIKLPKIFQVQGKKPWEITWLDTMELWRFGDYKAFTKLDLLCAIMGIPSPKSTMDGSQVAGVFWQEQNLSKIAHYCEQDVVAIAQLMMRYAYLPLIKPENIQYSDPSNLS